ncbi:MAG: hypothetical protein J7647_00205 [Cyanobacteria bacterium SBLK]|nr:hypothetical protein [Cyanobacteria bacterium SBLK]
MSTTQMMQTEGQLSEAELDVIAGGIQETPPPMGKPDGGCGAGEPPLGEDRPPHRPPHRPENGEPPMGGSGEPPADL